MLRLRTLALGALLAATAAGPAHAADPLYDVTYHLDVQHEWQAYETHPDRTVSSAFKATTALDGSLGRIALSPGNAAVVEQPYTAESTAPTTGSYSTITFVPPPGGTAALACDFEQDLPGVGDLDSGDPMLSGLGSIPIALRFSDRLRYATAAGDGCPVEPPPSFTSAILPVGKDLLDAEINLPNEVIGRGKTIELVKGPADGRCPGQERAGTFNCTFTWTGEVTFTRVDADDRPAPPPADPQPTPVPNPPAEPDDEFLAPLVKAATVSKDGRKLRVTARCGGGCRGSATVGVRGRAAHATRRHGARLALRLAPSPRAQTVTLTVPRRLRAPLRRARRASVLIALRGDTGARTTVTRRLTASRARR